MNLKKLNNSNITIIYFYSFSSGSIIVIINFREIFSFFFIKVIANVNLSPAWIRTGSGITVPGIYSWTLNFAFQPSINSSKLLNLIALSVLFLLINGTSVLFFTHMSTVSSFS